MKTSVRFTSRFNPRREHPANVADNEEEVLDEEAYDADPAVDDPPEELPEDEELPDDDAEPPEEDDGADAPPEDDFGDEPEEAGGDLDDLVADFVDVLSVTARKLQHFTKGRGWTERPAEGRGTGRGRDKKRGRGRGSTQRGTSQRQPPRRPDARFDAQQRQSTRFDGDAGYPRSPSSGRFTPRSPASPATSTPAASTRPPSTTPPRAPFRDSGPFRPRREGAGAPQRPYYDASFVSTGREYTTYVAECIDLTASPPTPSRTCAQCSVSESFGLEIFDCAVCDCHTCEKCKHA